MIAIAFSGAGERVFCPKLLELIKGAETKTRVTGLEYKELVQLLQRNLPSAALSKDLRAARTFERWDPKKYVWDCARKSVAVHSFRFCFSSITHESQTAGLPSAPAKKISKKVASLCFSVKCITVSVVCQVVCKL